MKNVMINALTLATAATLLSSGVVAHHGHSNTFDVNKPVDVSGLITRLRWVNPHSYVYFDVTTESGEVENWHCEMRAANVMKRSGWTLDMFEPGEAIRVQGIAARKSETGCYVETVTLGDEVVLNRYDQLEDNKGAPDTVREATTAWGVPNIAGDWAAEQRLVGPVSGPNAATGPGGLGGPGRPPRRPRGPAIELNDAGIQALAEMQAAMREQQGDADFIGRLDCTPRDLMGDWTFDQHANQIIQEQDTITLKYGFMDTVRTIHLDMDEHPADISPSFTGHSIGHWEGSVLVVDTIGFPAALLRRGPRVAGVASEQYHLVERITVDNDKGELTISYVADDLLYWQPGQTMTGSSTIMLSDLPWEPYNCEDLTEE